MFADLGEIFKMTDVFLLADVFSKHVRSCHKTFSLNTLICVNISLHFCIYFVYKKTTKEYAKVEHL